MLSSAYGLAQIEKPHCGASLRGWFLKRGFPRNLTGEAVRWAYLNPARLPSQPSAAWHMRPDVVARLGHDEPPVQWARTSPAANSKGRPRYGEVRLPELPTEARLTMLLALTTAWLRGVVGQREPTRTSWVWDSLLVLLLPPERRLGISTRQVHFQKHKFGRLNGAMQHAHM